MDVEYRMRMNKLSFLRKRTAVKNNIKDSYERMQRNRESYIATCDLCDIYQARIIETLNEPLVQNDNDNNNVKKNPESTSAFEYKIDDRIIKMIKAQDQEAKRRKLGIVTPKPVENVKLEEESYIPWHKQKNRRKILQYSEKLFQKLADRDPSKVEQQNILDMVKRNDKNPVPLLVTPTKKKSSKKKKKKSSGKDDDAKKTRSSDKKQRKKSMTAIDQKLEKRISKLEAAMKDAVIDEETDGNNSKTAKAINNIDKKVILDDNNNKKKKKDKKKKKKEDKNKEQVKDDNDDADDDDDNKKKKKEKKNKKKKKKKKDTKWDDVDLKKIIAKEKELKKKLK